MRTGRQATMESGWKRMRGVVLAVSLVFGSAAAGEAAPLLIGNFSYVEAADLTQTIAIDPFGLEPWPAALELTGVTVAFTSLSGNGTVFFDGDLGACTGSPVTLSASSGALQSPGDFAACGGPLPQDITSATLNFTYDTSLGIVTVDSLGVMLRDQTPTFEVQGIYFTPAETPTTPVPEPATLALLGSGLASVMLRRRRHDRRRAP